MKKFAALFAIAAIFAACAKEEIIPREQKEIGQTAALTFRATFDGFESKTVTDLDNVTRWVTGDIITITDNGTGTEYQYKVKEGGSATAEFEPVDETVTIPAGKASYDLSAVYEGGAAVIQTNEHGHTDASPLSATFSGAATDGVISLVFGQDASLITFSFVDASKGKAPLNLSELVIESIGGEELADGSSTITVTPEEESASTFQAVVSKVLLSKGLLIKATTAEDAAATADGTEFPAGTQFCKIVKAGGVDFTAGTHAIATVLLNQQGISSKADLVSFGYLLEHKLPVDNYIGATYINGGHATPEISVLADIDMGGTATQTITWDPIGQGCSEDETLRYYFDGKNHNIYNFNVVTDAKYFGLFGDVYDVTYWGGQIVNLNIGTRDGSTWDGVSKIFYESDDDGDHYVGTFIGRVKKNSKSNGNWQMLNCKNFVPIEISSGHSAKAYVGGFVGNASRVLFKNCKNYGDITNNSSKYGICIGGFAGVVWDKLTQKFDSCENYGNITVNDNGVQYVGGLVSRFTPADPSNNNVNTFTKCKNHGDITVNAVSTAIRVGGLVGGVIANDAYSVNFEECVNDGAISVTLKQNISTEDLISTGGIVGRGEAPVAYASCTNNGDVSVEFNNSSAKAACRVGGIFGDNTSNDSDCNACINTGDLTVNVSASNAAPGNYALGGIAGRLNTSSTTDGQDGSTLEGCSNEGDLKITANRGVIGGMVGAMPDGSIVDCTNIGSVEYHYKSQADTWAAAGGIVGDVWAPAKAITGCTNEGDVVCRTYGKQDVTKRGCYVGGIAGWTEEDTIVISGCVNSGEVRGNTHAKGNLSVPAAGGIIGYKESSTTDYDNINRGHVISIGTHYGSKATAGGIVGSLHYGTIETCWNYGFIEAGEKKSQWDWDLNQDLVNLYAGSIAGWYKTTTEDPNLACEGTIRDCYAGGSVRGHKTDGTETTLTSSNWTGLIVGYGTDPTDCHFLGTQDQDVTLLYWNIQNGMCADQMNNYSNFNSWVSSQNPDICVWTEAAKVYKDSGAEQGYNSLTGERTIPSFSYGHSKTICPYKKTDYPNMVTLRSGLTATGTKSIDDGHESSGLSKRTIYSKLSVAGKEINIVVVHLSKVASDTEHEALAEIKSILNQTVGKSSDSQSEYWMIIGDFNAICERDNNLPGSPYSSWTNDPTTKKPKALSFAVINEVLGHSAGFKDCIAEKYPGQFVSTRYYDQRIDYVFCNPKLFNCIDSIEIPTVNFGDNYGPFTLGSQTDLRSPSDHKPIKIKFTL